MQKLEHDLAALKDRLVGMGELVASMVELVTRSLEDPGQDISAEVTAREDRVNRLQLEIDHESVRMLTVYGLVAGNLRFVLMVFRINSELERMADQAVNMAQYLRLLVPADGPASFPEAPRMAGIVLQMLHQALRAFFDQDRQRAEQVLAQDDLVDALNQEVLRRSLRAPHDNVSQAVAEILWSRSLERIADQTTNICEEVVYIVSGDDIRHPATR